MDVTQFRSDPGEIHPDATCNSVHIKTDLLHTRAQTRALPHMKKSVHSFTNTQSDTTSKHLFFFLAWFETSWKLESLVRGSHHVNELVFLTLDI